MGRRTLLLIASILVAAVGTALIFLYVRGADDRANEDNSPVLVVVAADDIPAGVTVDKSRFTLQPVARKSLPDDESTFYSGDAGLQELQTRTSDAAAIAISKNAPILKSFFGGAAAASSVGLTKGQVEISIQVTDPNRVAGALQPRARVAVIVTTDGATIKELTGGDPAILAQLNLPAKAAENDDRKLSLSAALMSDIEVLRVGSASVSTNPDSGESVDNKIIALSVSPTQALTLRAGEKVGELSLAILGPDTPFPTPSGGFPLIKVLD